MERSQMKHQTKTVEEIQAWIVDWVAEELNITAAEISVEEPFVDLGMGSRQAVMLTGELEDWLVTTIDPSLAWEYPTIAKLSQHLIDPSES